ncbi:hypothetical protein DOTSEDRAFT_51264 [Dothistroma septosporum NZE10]|uniref:Uncharacterized protein n=1 Tax=Dothistroma septosporum (strain NZE10 / CBS 128990) TaxID=675120 RepID=N1PYF0_DOTSN|nr:hypothetical protein DOTSEDRAFT_51264 [Dothistroma septosporum NZE10]
MATEDDNDPLHRLQNLQRDLNAANESRLANIDRLAAELESSADNLRRLLERTKKSQASRDALRPDTLAIGETQYRITEPFRLNVQQVSDALNLDELEAAYLCIRSQLPDEDSQNGAALSMRAVLRFHEERFVLLDCLRILLQLGEGDEETADAFKETSRELLQGEGGGPAESSKFWRKCTDGLGDIEGFIANLAAHDNKMAVTDQRNQTDDTAWVHSQRLLLTRQHESLAAVMSYLLHRGYVPPEDYRRFLSHAAALQAPTDITVHYLPVLASGAAHFAEDRNHDAIRGIHSLFAPGPGQLQWKHSQLKAAAIAIWLAEYSGLLQNHDGAESDGEARTKLFFSTLYDGAFSFILGAASFLKPVVWHDPARIAITDFLVGSAIVMPPDAPRARREFAALTTVELQTFTEAFVTNMPDALRKLRLDEDENRRNVLSQSANSIGQTALELERFMVIMAYAYQDDAEAAMDFWSHRESNLYGFLRWVSQRLPTPRVAAFCLLLRSIATDDKSADTAHRFLLDDSTMTSGKLRKSYAVSWAQIFNELEVYVSSLKERPSAPQSALGPDRASGELLLEEPETGIMLDAYLGLTAHMCRHSPEARQWLLREQTFHLGEVMFALAQSATEARIRACCLDVLAALLTDNVVEVRNGMWVILDTWISGGGIDGSSTARVTRSAFPAKRYLQAYANDAESAASLIALLNALIAPTASSPDHTIDELPFPENLGAPHRHAGIDAYVDFVLDAVFAHKAGKALGDSESSLIDIVRYECLHFAFQCLSTFNEDLVSLANTTQISVESTMETKSLTAYARLHPFARVMEWLFDKNVISQLFQTLQQNIDLLDNAEPESPLVNATLKSIQILSLAWQLQPTYFDLVRPTILSQKTKAQPVNSTWASIDEIFLTYLHAIVDIAEFTACRHVDISLECLHLLQRIGSSRKLTDSGGSGDSRHGSRIVSVLAPGSAFLTLQLAENFVVQAWDLESDGTPLQVLRANATLDLLNANLDTSSRRPGIAHCLLGFHCRDRDVDVVPRSAYHEGRSLFHAIARCATDAELITQPAGNSSWLMALKRRCLEVILKLATAPMTSPFVQADLRAMEFLPALSRKLADTPTVPAWDGLSLQDGHVLLHSSSAAIRDFLYIRAGFCRFAAVDLRAAYEQSAFSVQEKIISALLGTVVLPGGEQLPTISIFDLSDFFELETVKPFVVPSTKYFDDLDVSSFTKDDSELGRAFDTHVTEKALVLRKRELKDRGIITEPAGLEQADNETQAILAALASQNSFMAIQVARSVALEAWTESISLMVTKGAMDNPSLVTFSLQGLLIAAPKYERALSGDLDSAALLAKLILTLTHALSHASQDSSRQTASVTVERLLAVFRVSLKAITDSATSLALRDVAYRTTCAILAAVPKAPVTSRTSPTSSSKQLLHLIQTAGERLFAVVTEDAFSGRGITRVSALLFLDSLVLLYQNLKVNTSMHRAFTKLNFVPVLLDTSIGNVAAAFRSEEETVATLAYFHTAMTLLLRICQNADGTQLLLNSGLFQAIDHSKLFSTDPDLGLDVDNPQALQEFYAILADTLRLVTAVAVQRSRQPAKLFLQQHRYTVQAIFKQASRGLALDVAEELSRLILATDFLDDDQAALSSTRANGFT